LSAALLNEIVHRFGDFIYDLVTLIRVEAFENNDKTKSDLDEFFDIVNGPLDFISTTYKQQTILEETGFYTASKTIWIGTRDDIVFKENRNEIVQKDLTFQYVSIYQTIELLLKNEEFRISFNEFSNNSDIHKYYDQHDLFNNKKNLRILLYFDDLELCNGFGDVAGIYKSVMFYFTITNLTRRRIETIGFKVDSEVYLGSIAQC
jgi:hypothetical protein